MRNMKLTPPSIESIQAAVAQDLMEDRGSGDISAALIPEELVARAQIITREVAVVCGIPWANAVFHAVDPRIATQWQVNEGDSIKVDQILVYLEGPARSLLTAERCALNWLQSLSATATVVRSYVDELQGMQAQLLDTRKTIPGLRAAQKYAVRCGGAHNHRMGLYDAYLIKENHIAACGSITQAVAEARAQHPEKKIEIEVENMSELAEALEAKADTIMLDNFSLDEIHKAVALSKAQAKLEVSGGVDFSMLSQLASTGVDYISVGALTKNIKAIDLSMRFI